MFGRFSIEFPLQVYTNMVIKKTTSQKMHLGKMGKRAVFMEIYLPIITIFMCGLVIGMYVIQSRIVENSFVTPKAVLDLGLQQKIFEMQEEELILKSANEANFDANILKDKFCQHFIEPEQESFRGFLFFSLSESGRVVDKKVIDESSEWESFCNNIYSFSIVNKQVSFERKNLEKTSVLKSPQITKNNFDVKFSYAFSKSSSV